jgi:hypothetical protein
MVGAEGVNSPSELQRALPRPIFIGGAGRSGTTLLYRLIGAHPDIYGFGFETRFLIDPDGLQRSSKH